MRVGAQCFLPIFWVGPGIFNTFPNGFNRGPWILICFKGFQGPTQYCPVGGYRSKGLTSGLLTGRAIATSPDLTPNGAGFWV